MLHAIVTILAVETLASVSSFVRDLERLEPSLTGLKHNYRLVQTIKCYGWRLICERLVNGRDERMLLNTVQNNRTFY